MSADQNEDEILTVKSRGDIDLSLVEKSVRMLCPDNAAVIENVWGDICSSSPTKQMVIGGVSGWCTGYVAGKIGKMVLVAFGGSIIILQLAQSQGLVQINWKAIESKVTQTQKKVKRELSDKLPTLIERVKDYSKSHIYLSGSFCLGLLFGVFS